MPRRRDSRRHESRDSSGSADRGHDFVSCFVGLSARRMEVDVTIGGSQKGLMLPPGLSFNAISEKARRANKNAKLPRAYWDWEDMLKQNTAGFFPYTPPTTLLYGLREA